MTRHVRLESPSSAPRFIGKRRPDCRIPLHRSPYMCGCDAAIQQCVIMRTFHVDCHVNHRHVDPPLLRGALSERGHQPTIYLPSTYHPPHTSVLSLTQPSPNLHLLTSPMPSLLAARCTQARGATSINRRLSRCCDSTAHLLFTHPSPIPSFSSSCCTLIKRNRQTRCKSAS